MQYLHTELGIAHRSLSPSSIIFGELGNLKIINMSRAVYCSEDYVASDDYQGPSYQMCPEYIISKSYDSKKLDIWNLGQLLYFISTKEIPFQTLNDD